MDSEHNDLDGLGNLREGDQLPAGGLTAISTLGKLDGVPVEFTLRPQDGKIAVAIIDEKLAAQGVTLEVSVDSPTPFDLPQSVVDGLAAALRDSIESVELQTFRNAIRATAVSELRQDIDRIGEMAARQSHDAERAEPTTPLEGTRREGAVTLGGGVPTRDR